MTTADHDAAAGRFAVVLGRCDDMRAEVFVRYTPGAGSEVADLQIAGTLVGPRRGRDVILPVTARLAAVAGGDEPRPPLARAILTEPAFWTPELPNLYRLEAAVLRRGERVASIDRLVGLRRLGVRGRSLWLEGRRWVPRAVACATVADFDAGAMHASELAVAASDPPAAVCERADEAGVAIIAILDGAAARNPAAAAARIASWAIHPSVVAVIVPRESSAGIAAAIAAAARSVKGTMLVAHEVDGCAPPPAVPAGIDALVVGLPAGGLPHEAWRLAAPAAPLLAWRQDAGVAAEPRRACDRLQAALATWGVATGTERLPWDWAGYAVGRLPEVR